MAAPEDQDRWIRYFIYTHFVEEERPPSAQETAERFHLSLADAQASYQRLHERHAIFLQPGTLDVRIANPFSAVPTDFRVHVGAHSYYGNCCWDAFGIPAALHSNARIEAQCAQSQQPLEFEIENGELRGDDALVLIGVPFRNWYDDTIFT
jgi:Alkylmercury lyase